MKINNNISAVISNKHLLRNEGYLSISMEKLSSGYKINHSGDDPSGMAISSKMRAQIRGLNQASENASDGTSVLETADGALNEVTSMIQRMRELSVQSANGTNSDSDRKSIQDEITQLTDEIQRISETTEFNTKSLLDGSLDKRVYTEGISRVTLSTEVPAGNYELTINEMPTNAYLETSKTWDELAEFMASDEGKDSAGLFLNINGYGVTLPYGKSGEEYFTMFRQTAEKGEAFISDYYDEDSITPNNISITSISYGDEASLDVQMSPELKEFLGFEWDERLNSIITDRAYVKVVPGENAVITLNKDGSDFGVQSTYSTITKESGISASRSVDGRRIKVTDVGGFEIDFLIDEKTVDQYSVLELKKQRASLNDEQDNIKKERDELDTEQVTLQANIDRAQEEIDDAEDQVDQETTEIGYLYKSISDLKNDIDTLNDEIDEVYSKISEINKNIDNTNTVITAIERKQKGADFTDEELNELKDILGESSSIYALLNTKYSELSETEKTKLQSKLSSYLDDQNAVLENQNSALERQKALLETKNKTLASKEEDLANKQAKLDEINEALDAKKTYVADTTAELAGVKLWSKTLTDPQSRDDLVTELRALIKKYNKEDLTVEDLQQVSALSGLDTNILELIQKNGESLTNDELNTIKTRMEEIHSSLDLSTDINARDILIVGYNNDIMNLENQIATATVSLSDLEKMITNLSDKLNTGKALWRKNALGEEPLTIAEQEKLDEYNANKDAWQDKLTEYEPDREKLQTEIDGYESDKTDVENKLKIATAEKEALEKENRWGKIDYELFETNELIKERKMGIDIEITDIGPMNLQIGANKGQQMEVRIGSVSAESLYLDQIDVTTQRGATRALEQLDEALAKVSYTRSSIGAYSNRLEHATNSLNETSENMESAISRIQDVDMATEMTEYTKYNVLQQASTSALSQANELPQTALQLLQ